MTSSRPNILFVTADQWRGDCTGYAGHRDVKTPNLDAVASQGTAFLNHYAAAAPCSPARAAIYTGLYAMNNRAVANGTPLDHRFDNMARAARRAGYVPTLFGYTDVAADPREHDVQDPALRTYEGVLPGFDVEQSLLGDQAPWKSWLKARGYSQDVWDAPYALPEQQGELVPTGPTSFAAEHSQTAYLTGRLIEWLQERPEKEAWFAHLSLIHPHPPFVAPAPYHDMYNLEAGPDFLQTSEEVAAHPVMERLQNKPVDDFVPGAKGQLTHLSEKDRRRIRSIYYGLISEVDAQLGRLMAHLKATGQWDNTIIILTSDHGEMMGDYGLFGKGGFLPESQHIPLVVRLPGQTNALRCDGFTSGVDLFPTLLDLMQIEPTNSLDGESLAPILRGEVETTKKTAVIWEYDFRDQILPEDLAQMTCGGRGTHIQCLLTKNTLYMQSPTVPALLFDLSESGVCDHNIAAEADQLTLRLQAAEHLLRLRMLHADQTLANIRLGAQGARSIVSKD